MSHRFRLHAFALVAVVILAATVWMASQRDSVRTRDAEPRRPSSTTGRATIVSRSAPAGTTPASTPATSPPARDDAPPVVGVAEGGRPPATLPATADRDGALRAARAWAKGRPGRATLVVLADEPASPAVEAAARIVRGARTTTYTLELERRDGTWTVTKVR